MRYISKAINNNINNNSDTNNRSSQTSKKSFSIKKIINRHRKGHGSYDLLKNDNLKNNNLNRESYKLTTSESESEPTISSLPGKYLWLPPEDLKSINDHLFLDINNLNTKANTAKNNITNILTKFSGQGITPSINDTAKLSLYFETLSKELPSQHQSQKDICKLIALNLKCDWQETLIEALRPSLIKKIEPLFHPGASDQEVRSISLGISNGIQIPMIADASFQNGVGVSSVLSKSPDDEAQLFQEAKVEGSIFSKIGTTLGISEKVEANVSAAGKLGYGRSNFTLCDSPNDYVTSNGHTMAYAKRKDGSSSTSLSSLGKKSELQSYPETLQDTVNSRATLNSLLSKINCKVQIKQPEPIKKDNTGFGSYVEKSTEVEASAVFGIDADNTPINIQAGVALKARNQRVESNGHVPQQFHTLLSENHPNFTLPESLTTYARDFMENNTRPNSSPEDKVNAAMKGLEDIKDKIEQYYLTVQKYEAKINRKDRSQNQKEKHNLEDQLGAIGRYQYLQFAAASHAYFSCIIKDNTPEGGDSINQKNLIQESADLIYNPSIKISKQKLADIAAFTKLVYLAIDDNIATLRLSMPIFTGQLDIIKRNRIHPNRVREGDYIYINLSGQFNLSLQGSIDTTVLSEQITSMIERLGISLPGGSINIQPDAAIGGSLSKTWCYYKPDYVQNDPHFPGEKGWRYKFTQTKGTLDNSIGTTLNLPIIPTVNLVGKLGYTSSQTRVINEKLGTDDLTYTMNRFKSMHQNKLTEDNTEWHDFVKLHQKEYEQIFINLADESHLMTKEVEYFFKKELFNANSEEAKQEFSSFNQAMKNYKNDPSYNTFMEAKRYFDDYLERQLEPIIKGHRAQWKEVKYDKDENSSLKNTTQLLRKLKAHPRDKINKRNLYITKL